MAFGEHLLQVIRMEESGLARQKIVDVWGSEMQDEQFRATRFQLACGDAVYWVLQSAAYDADYLLECLNERYGREEILEAIDSVTEQIDKATADRSDSPSTCRVPHDTRY